MFTDSAEVLLQLVGQKQQKQENWRGWGMIESVSKSAEHRGQYRARLEMTTERKTQQAEKEDWCITMTIVKNETKALAWKEKSYVYKNYKSGLLHNVHCSVCPLDFGFIWPLVDNWWLWLK